MSRLQTIFLVSVITFFIPQLLWAAEGDDQTDVEIEDTAESVDDSAARMLRHTNTVEGYQTLTVAGVEIDASYLEETLGERHGAVILLHDKGEQFESQGVVTPLRHALPQLGWSTLTLAFNYPYEANILLSTSTENTDTDIDTAENTEVEAQGEEAGTSDEQVAVNTEEARDDSATDSLPEISNQQRLETAIAFLQAKDIQRIILLGHGVGGLTIMETIPSITAPISALILVGTPELASDGMMENIDFPILDLYGEKDLEGIAKAVHHRKIVMKRNNLPLYTAREVLGADHIFSGLQASLNYTVSGWLRKNFIIQDDN